MATSLPVATSHSLIVRSKPAEASVLPSGLNDTDDTTNVCPFSVARSLPVGASQSLMVMSSLAEARVLPSGLHATEVTLCV